MAAAPAPSPVPVGPAPPPKTAEVTLQPARLSPKLAEQICEQIEDCRSTATADEELERNHAREARDCPEA